MSNNRGWWKLTVENVDNDENLELSNADLEHIAEQVKEGFTEGEIVADNDEEELEPDVKTAYFTFGQDHAHRFANITLDKDIVVKITDKDPRGTMFEYFGPKWAMQYDEKPDMRYYYRGIYDLNKAEIVED